MQDLISVIVPVKNEEKYLTECIESILAQDYRPLEIIFVLDGCTDSSLEIIKAYKEKKDFISYYEVSFSSPGLARNLGIDKAKGKYLMFVDADDLLKENAVTKLYESIKENEADISAGNYQRLWNKKKLHANKNAPLRKYSNNGPEFLFTGFFSLGNLSYVWGKLYLKEFIDKNHIIFKDYPYAEDKVFNIDCAFNNARWCFSDTYVYSYRRNENSLSFMYRPDAPDTWMLIAEDMFNRYSGKKSNVNFEIIPSLIVIFACFFDCQTEYKMRGESILTAAKKVKVYSDGQVTKKASANLLKHKNLINIPSFLYRFLIFNMSLLLKLKMNTVIAFLVKIIVDLGLDMRLSDTDRRNLKD